MAVPFSKPCYSGASGSAGNRRPRARPDNHNNSDQHVSNQGNHEHPVTRFLYGDGQIHLDNLSLTSRIAFYALYEAWRLLQDLTTGSQPATSTTTTRGQRRRRRSPSTTTNQQVFSCPDVIPQEMAYESTQSPKYASDVESAGPSPFQSPMKSSEQVKRRRLDPMDVSNQHPGETYTAAAHELPMTNQPDMIPKNYRQVYTMNNNVDFWPSNYPDLIPVDYHHDNEEEDFDSDFEEQVDKGIDDVDGPSSGQALIIGGVDWHKLGNQLCSIANAFESTFYRPVTDEQKAVYEAFQRIKASTVFESQFRDNSISSFAKTVCRQVLLSSIWVLLKKVL